MLHSSFAPYQRQQRLFSRIIKSLFGAAGCFWIVIYTLHFLGHVDHTELASLRGGQTAVYFILLTLWGLEYMREVRRYKALIALAENLHAAVRDVEISQLSNISSTFAVLGPVGPGGSYVFPAINVIGLVTAAMLIVMRYVAAFQYL